MGMPDIVSNNIDRFDSISDIIQSVALEQAALAHILNAEGEELQKIIALEDVSTDELMEANKSIQSMVDSISKLEIMLQYKLKLFEDCLCVYSHTCELMTDSEVTLLSGGQYIKVNKTDKNKYVIVTTLVDVPATFVVSTTPELPIEAIVLQENMRFENNILYVDKTLGQVVLRVGKDKCEEDINILIVATS